MDAWILHNRDQNFIFPVIFTPLYRWYRKSAADTSLAFRATQSGWWMNSEACTILNPRSFAAIFSDYGCQNTEKSVLPRESDVQTFLEGEENQNTKWKWNERPKVVYPVALVMAFLAAENENWQLEYLPQADFSRVLKRFHLLIRTKSITKNFLNWKLGPLFVFVVFQRIFFILRLSADALYDFIRGLSILSFSFVN